MMKPSLPPLLLPFILLCGAAPALVAQGGDQPGRPRLTLRAEPLSCADRSITARAVRTTEDVQAFVQCAYEFVQEVGFEDTRRAFHEDERWKSGSIYVFVDELPAMSDMSRAFVYPPDPSRERTPWGLLIDVYGNNIVRNFTRVVGSFGEGWVYSTIGR